MLWPIDIDLLKAYKKGDVTLSGVQIRTRFRLNIKNAIDAIANLSTAEHHQLSVNETAHLAEMITFLNRMGSE